MKQISRIGRGRGGRGPLPRGVDPGFGGSNWNASWVPGRPASMPGPAFAPRLAAATGYPVAPPPRPQMRKATHFLLINPARFRSVVGSISCTTWHVAIRR